MSNKKQIPEFAKDQNGEIKKVQPKAFRFPYKSEWQSFCNKKYDQSKYEQNSQKIKLRVKRYRQNNSQKVKQRQTKYKQNNREKVLASKKRQRQKNAQTYKISKSKWYQNNKEHATKKSVQNRRKRKKSDPHYNMLQNFRNNHGKRFKYMGGNKAGLSSFQNIMKITPDGFKSYIQNQFDQKMTWENRGLKGWHMDHIICYNLVQTFPIDFYQYDYESFLFRVSHHTNLKPMWSTENLQKKDKTTHELFKLSDQRYNAWRISQNKEFDYQI